MTWSIVALDKATGGFAVAVTTCAFAVGARCPFVRAGVGAVATQSIANSYLGPRVLDLLAAGETPGAALEIVLRDDEGRHLRQIHAVDAKGRTAAWTGKHCVEWCGDRTSDGFSAAGNMLAGPAVVGDSFETFASRSDLAMPERLMAALDAGQEAGGDKRGKQSAALLMVTTEDFPEINLRVDDHVAPLTELRRLVSVWRRDIEPRMAFYPTKAAPSGTHDPDVIEADWISRGLNLRFRR